MMKMMFKKPKKVDFENFVETGDEDKTEKEYHPFVYEIIEDMKDHRTKEYKELVNIEKLNAQLPEDWVIKSNRLLKVMIKREKVFTKGLNVNIGVAVAIWIISMFLGDFERQMCYFLMGGLLWLNVIFLGMVKMSVIMKEKELLKDGSELEIKDENGKSIKKIWFLYHNLNFNNDEQKEKFLKENYNKYNEKLKIGFKKCVEKNILVSEYLSSFKKIVEKELLK